MKFQHQNITAALTCCKDYTYDLKRGDYAVYNLDLIWLLENIMFYNNTDPELNKMILEFIRHHFLYYIRGYLGNNYKDPKAGEPYLGGRGVAICFPRTKNELETSIYYGKGKPRFVRDTIWKKMLLSYYKMLPREKEIAKTPVTRNINEHMRFEVEEDSATSTRPHDTRFKWHNFHQSENTKGKLQ